MPKKNLLAFVVLTAALIAGWAWVKFFVLEQPRPPKDGANVAEKKDGKKDTAKEKGDGDKKEIAKSKDEDKSKEQAVGKEPPAIAAKVEPEQLAKDIPFPDPQAPRFGEYFIRGTITTRGAGIRNLTLTKFQKADEYGRPVFNPDGSKTLLQLIEDDPIVASFLMYHYRDAEADDAEPKLWPCDTTLGQKVWEIDRVSSTPESSEVVLSCKDIPFDNLVITKTYTLKPQQYHIGLTIEIHDNREVSKKADKSTRLLRYQLAGSHGLPVEGEWYTSVYRTPMMAILEDSGQPRRDLSESQHRIAMQGGGARFPPGQLGNSRILYAGVDTQYFSSLIVVDDKQESPKEVLAWCRPTLESQQIAGMVDGIIMTNPDRPILSLRTKEALSRPLEFIMLPRTKNEVERRQLKKGDQVLINYYNADNAAGDRVATDIHIGSVPRPQFDDITVRVASKLLKLEPNSKVVHKYLLYHGPAKVRLLAQFSGDQAVEPPSEVDRYAETLHLATLTDYQSWVSSKIPFMGLWSDLLILTTRFMHWLLYWLHWCVGWTGGGYGLSIILLTLIVRGAMFPVSRRSALLSQRMQALGPEIKKVQEKYKNDPQAKTAAVMELYRKHGVNPFGSCLPMLLQMPFFLGLYYCLQESINFRLAGFLWMDNLAAPDMLIRWGDGIPIISDPDNMAGGFFSFLYLGPFFNLLPVIAVALMLMQQKMMTPPPADEQQEMQQKMMKYMFVVMGVMFYKVAAGLCVYFIVSSLWGLAERKLLPKKTLAPAGTAATSSAGGNGSTTTGKPARPKSRPEKKEKKPETTIQKVKDWWEEILKQAQKK